MKIFNNKTIAMTAVALSIAGCGTDELPDKTGNSFGQLALLGDARVGETLSATVSDGNGVEASTINYTWLADDSAISGATASTLTLAESHAGMRISVSVSYTDNANFQETIKSGETSAVLTNYVGAIDIAGTLEAGKLLTATLTDDNGFDLASVTYTWYTDGVAIDGANEATYALTENEVGKAVSVKATYVDNDAYSEEVMSQPTELIAPQAENTPAEFEGLTASTTNTVTGDLTGTINVIDDDAGENAVTAVSGLMTTYGMFSIESTGAWSYTLDTANPSVAALVDASDV